jgi:hypothetical protein
MNKKWVPWVPEKLGSHSTKPNVDHFQDQIELIVSDKLSQGYTLKELTSPLSNKLYWWKDDLYRNEKLHYEHANMTIVAWCNTVDLLQGSESEQRFLDDLADLIYKAADNHQYRLEIERMEGQEKLNHEHRSRVFT